MISAGRICYSSSNPLDIFLHTWSTCLFQFKVLVTKISKSFCSVTILNFELFIMRLRLKLSIDLVCFCLVDITIPFVFSTFDLLGKTIQIHIYQERNELYILGLGLVYIYIDVQKRLFIIFQRYI